MNVAEEALIERLMKEYTAKETIDSMEAYHEGECPYCGAELELAGTEYIGWEVIYYLACHNCRTLFIYDTYEAYLISVREELVQKISRGS